MNWAGRRKQELAAVCLADGQVHAAQVFRARGAPPAVTFCRSEPAGLDAGAAIARLRQELSLQHFRCTTVLADRDYRFLVMEAPDVPATERNDAIRWRLAEVLDYPPDTAVIDTLPVATSLDGLAPVTSLHVAATPRSTVERLAAQFRGADVQLTAIDVAEAALRNVAALFAEPGMGVAFAWFGLNGSGITFVAGTELCLVRQLDPSAGEAVTALEMKDERMLERIELGLQRSIDHFERNFSAVPINRVLLGPFAGDGPLAEYLGSHLSLPVERARLDRVLDLSAVPDLLDPARASQCLVTLGAALRH